MTTYLKKKQYNLKWKLENPKAYKAAKKRYYLANKAKILARRKENYLNNPNSKIESASKYYLTNKTKISEYKKQYRAKNAKKINDWMKSYYGNNLNARISRNLRSRISVAIRKQNAVKKSTLLRILGCDLESFKRHIEEKFKLDMNWSNYGSWHIDHIKPLAKFDLTDLEQQRLAFNYQNLQPLWAIENIKKGAKYV